MTVHAAFMLMDRSFEVRHRSSSTRGDETLTVQPAGAVVVHFSLRPLAEERTPAVSGEAQSGSVSVVSRAVEKQTDVWGHGFLFQYIDRFSADALEFLRTADVRAAA